MLRTSSTWHDSRFSSSTLDETSEGARKLEQPQDSSAATPTRYSCHSVTGERSGIPELGGRTTAVSGCRFGFNTNTTPAAVLSTAYEPSIVAAPREKPKQGAGTEGTCNQITAPAPRSSHWQRDNSFSRPRAVIAQYSLALIEFEITGSHNEAVIPVRKRASSVGKAFLKRPTSSKLIQTSARTAQIKTRGDDVGNRTANGNISATARPIEPGLLLSSAFLCPVTRSRFLSVDLPQWLEVTRHVSHSTRCRHVFD